MYHLKYEAHFWALHLEMQIRVILHWYGQKYYIIHNVLKMLKLQNKIEKSVD